MLRYFITGLEERNNCLKYIKYGSSLTTTLGFNMPRLQKTQISYKP